MTFELTEPPDEAPTEPQGLERYPSLRAWMQAHRHEPQSTRRRAMERGRRVWDRGPENGEIEL